MLPTAHRTTPTQVEQCTDYRNSAGGPSSGLWTIEELLVLNKAKKQDWLTQKHGTPVQRNRSGNQRWEAIAEYCRQEGVSRTSSQCKSCWERYHKEWKKINSYENNIPSAHSSYWSMTEAERRERDLPRTYNRRLHDAISSWLGGREACNPQNILTESKPASTPRGQPIFSSTQGSSGAQSEFSFTQSFSQDVHENDVRGGTSQSNQPAQSNQPQRDNRGDKEQTQDRQLSGRKRRRKRVDAVDNMARVVSSSSETMASAILESSKAQVETAKLISASQVEAMKQISESEMEAMRRMHDASLHVEVEVAKIIAEAIKSLKK